MKPFFSDRMPRISNITLSEGNEIISNPATCAEIFNNFFSNAVENLDIDRTLHVDCLINSDDSVENAIRKSSEHSHDISRRIREK